MERQQHAQHTCVLRVPRHSARVNRGFNPIQHQQSHHSRRVPFFWTEKHLDIFSGKLGASVSNRSFAVLSLEAMHCFLLCAPLLLNVSCFVIKTPYMETTIIIIHPPSSNFAVYTVHMRSYMLPSRPMGSIYKVLKSSDVMHSYNQSFDTN